MWRAAFICILALVGCSGSDSSGSSGTGGAAGAGGAGGAAGAGGLAGAANAEQVKGWARQVALGTEYGSGDKVIARWNTSPSLSVVQGTAADRVHLDELIPVLNKELGANKIQVVTDGDEGAQIRVYFVPLAEFDGIGQKNGFPVVPGNYGYFYMFWDQSHALTKSFVLLATDVLSGDQLRHYTFEELTQSLGMASDSEVFEDSIFYASGFDGGDASELSSLDKRLLRFVYARTEPGDTPPKFDAAFDLFF
jgi:hypothetical protein